MMVVSDKPQVEIDSNSDKQKDKEERLCPNCGFVRLDYDENGELSCPLCNWGKTRRHT
jgi:rubrerythrin